MARRLLRGPSEHGMPARVLQERGRPASFLTKSRIGEPRNKPLARGATCSRAVRSEERAHARYRRAVGSSKRGGKAMQESESPIVPTKPGNQRSKGLGGGKGRPGSRTGEEKDVRDPVLGKRHNETSTDSEAGLEGPQPGLHERGARNRPRMDE